MKKKMLFGALIILSFVIAFSLYSNLQNSRIIGFNRISSVHIEKFGIDEKMNFELIDSYEISDPSQIANLVRALNKPVKQKLTMDLSVLIFYDNNYKIRIAYQNGSELKLVVTFDAHPLQGEYAPSRVKVSENFFDDDNVYLLSEDDVTLFTSIIY